MALRLSNSSNGFLTNLVAQGCAAYAIVDSEVYEEWHRDELLASLAYPMVSTCLECLGVAASSRMDSFLSDYFVERVGDGQFPVCLGGLRDLLSALGVDLHTFTIEFNAAYDATVAALLPMFRQNQLEAHIDIADETLTLGSKADFAPMGQRTFFMVAVRVIAQRLLLRRGIKVPLLLIFNDSYGTDWTFAVQRLIVSSKAPILTLIDPLGLEQRDARLLGTIDWNHPATNPCFRVGVTSGTLFLERLKALPVW